MHSFTVPLYRRKFYNGHIIALIPYVPTQVIKGSNKLQLLFRESEEFIGCKTFYILAKI